MKNNIVKTLVELEKKGIKIYLTDKGYTEFLTLMQQGLGANYPESTENVG